MAADSQAAGRWSLNSGTEYYAAGVGTGIAGFRAKLGIIDDPIRSRQDADSELIRDRIWDWYINDFKTRLVPHAAEILIQCMTGDTPVLMADGYEKPLRDIRQVTGWRRMNAATFRHPQFATGLTTVLIAFSKSG